MIRPARVHRSVAERWNRPSARGRSLAGPVRFMALAALALGLWVACGVHAEAYQPNCPLGQIPAFNGQGCMPVQTNPSLAGYGLPSQGSVRPEAGRNGAPAIQRCNGQPTPFGQPCPGDPKPPPDTSGTASQPKIIVQLAPPGSGIYVPNSPATMALTGLLGEWYTGWMAYLAATLNWSDANINTVSTIFATIPDCFLVKRDSCQNMIWQQINTWISALPAAYQPFQNPASQNPASQNLPPASPASQPPQQPDPTSDTGG